jgi:hypothetical protein
MASRCKGDGQCMKKVLCDCVDECACGVGDKGFMYISQPCAFNCQSHQCLHFEKCKTQLPLHILNINGGLCFVCGMEKLHKRLSSSQFNL